MTMIVGVVSPLLAIVAADTVSWDSRAGQNIHLSKLHPIAAARTVITGRGPHELIQHLANEAEKLRSFDEIADAASDILERAYEHLPAAAHRPSWFDDGYEAYIIGRSDRTHWMHATALTRNAAGFARHEIPPTNSFMAPWSRDALGEKPLGRLLEGNHEIIAAARTQAAWLRGLYPEVQVGGDLVVARIEAASMSLETICIDL